jgi:hypothetical protein
VPESWHWPVGVSLSNEFGYQRRDFSPDTWTWEIRPIVDKKIGRWYLSFHPTLERWLHGDNVKRGVEFSPQQKRVLTSPNELAEDWSITRPMDR